MEKKAENYLKKLSEIGKEIIETIVSELKRRGIKSINLYEYWSERNVDRYTFHDVDNDGYGVVLYVDKLYVTDDGVEMKMLDTDDCEWADWDEENLSTTDRYYLLDMVEQVLNEADEEDNGRVLGADESFDDWEA